MCEDRSVAIQEISNGLENILADYQKLETSIMEVEGLCPAARLGVFKLIAITFLSKLPTLSKVFIQLDDEEDEGTAVEASLKIVPILLQTTTRKIALQHAYEEWQEEEGEGEGIDFPSVFGDKL